MQGLGTSCVNGTLCYQLAGGLPAGLVAVVVAIISLRQYYLARAKLKLDLFDKRFKVYEEIYEGLGSVLLLELTGDYDELETPFRSAMNEAPFLFGKETEEYISAIYKKYDELGKIYLRKKDNDGKVLPSDTEALAHLTQWFKTETTTGLKERFSPYLNFDKWH